MKKTIKTDKPYIAYIASSEHTPAFDSARGKTAGSALAAVKRKHSPDWRDLTVFVKFDSSDYSEI